MQHQTKAVLCTILILFCNAGMVSLAQSCTLINWSNVHDPDSALTATESARYEGTCGLSINLDSAASAAFVEDTTPENLITPVTEYVVRFYLYTGDIALADNDSIELLTTLDDGLNPVFRFMIYAAAGSLYTRLAAYEDDGSGFDTGTGGMRILPGWRAVEISWTASTGEGVNDGSLTITLDGVLGGVIDNLVDLDTDALEIGRVRIGLLSGNSVTVTGAYDIDSFASGRTGTMGVISKSCSGEDVNVENATFLPGSTSCTASGGMTLGHRITFDPGSVTELSGSTVTFNPGVRVLPGAQLSVR